VNDISPSWKETRRKLRLCGPVAVSANVSKRPAQNQGRAVAIALTMRRPTVGPVAAIIPFADEPEAVRIANDTPKRGVQNLIG
jgi:hypothetical protein